MRIGLTGGAATVDRLVAQAEQAEADGFTSLWYASLVQGDPLVAMAIAGRATERIELGTAVLQTYPCHPLLQANRVTSQQRFTFGHAQQVGLRTIRTGNAASCRHDACSLASSCRCWPPDVWRTQSARHGRSSDTSARRTPPPSQRCRRSRPCACSPEPERMA